MNKKNGYNLLKINNKGLTFIELLIVISIIAILAVIIFVMVNPLQRFRDARNSQRWQDITAVVKAIRVYEVSNKGIIPSGIDTKWRMLGTDSSGCNVQCGSSDASEKDDTSAEFSAGTFSSTQWDSANSWVELTSAGQISGSGTYTSVIRGASNASTSWTNLSWQTERPTYRELPGGGITESVYSSGNAVMTSNQLLFHMNDGVGSTSFADSSGNSANGSCSSSACPTYTSVGKLGGAFIFDGIDDSINLSIPNPTTAVTVAAWFKPLGVPKNSYHIIFGPWNVEISVHATRGKIRTGIQTTAVTRRVFESGPSVLDGKWHHLAMTYDGSTLIAYVDGVQTGQTSVTGNLTYGPRFIGNWYNSYVANGVIDEAVIFSRDLSGVEISDMYKRGALEVKYQVRSCDDSVCSGENFIGPDGTASTYYAQSENSSGGLPTVSLSNISTNKYFQYQATLETDSSAISPELSSVSIFNSLSGNISLQNSCLDLSNTLRSQLPKIPQDPQTGSAAKTYYAVRRQSTGQINAVACSAEDEQEIVITN